MTTTEPVGSQVLTEIRARLEADDNRPLTLAEIDEILPDSITQESDLSQQLRLLRIYIEDHDLELKAGRQLRDRGIAAVRKNHQMPRQQIADLSGTSVPHVAACIGGRVPGAHLQ